MAFSLNKVILIGNIGQDPETRFTQSNTPVTNFSMATTRSFKDKNDNWVNETDWHNVVAWNLSEWFRNNLKKGSKVCVEGRLQTSSYDDKDGNKRYKTEVIVSQIIPLDKSGNSTENYNVENPESPEDDKDLPF